MQLSKITLKPVEADDVEELFPLVYQSTVTETILWDGPISRDELRKGLSESERDTRNGSKHQFTIIENASGKKIGSVDIRPYAEGWRGDMGLWIGVPFQGKGYGTEVVSLAVLYGFKKLNMEKIEATIFVGNQASRRIFEKCGFKLEGTIRKCVKKRGKILDEWLFGITKEDL